MNASIRARFLTTPHGERSLFARAHGISRSTLYYKPKQPPKDLELKERIEAILGKHPFYGYRRIVLVLKDLKVNHKRVARVMRLYNLRPRMRKRRKSRRNKGHPDTKTPNLLETWLYPVAPNVGWAGDFTEFKFHGRKLFLATVIDLWTRMILGWALASRHTTEFVLEAMEEAKRKMGAVPWLFHSDQGSEYTSFDCTYWMERHGIHPSCSPKGKPWKNGTQEAFYNNLKNEFGEPNQFETITDFWSGLSEYICYYNEDRIHGEIKMIPNERYLEWKRRAPPGIIPPPPKPPS